MVGLIERLQSDVTEMCAIAFANAVIARTFLEGGKSFSFYILMPTLNIKKRRFSFQMIQQIIIGNDI